MKYISLLLLLPAIYIFFKIKQILATIPHEVVSYNGISNYFTVSLSKGMEAEHLQLLGFYFYGTAFLIVTLVFIYSHLISKNKFFRTKSYVFFVLCCILGVIGILSAYYPQVFI